MPKKPKYWAAYRTHIYNANVRGIEMLFSFEEWLKEWEDSGRLLERGRRKGQYVMARINDEGHYGPGNVKIITHSENIREKKYKDSQREAIRKSNLGREYKKFKLTVEQRQKQSAALKGKKKPPRKLETNLKVSESFRQRRAVKWQRLEELGKRLAVFASV